MDKSVFPTKSNLLQAKRSLELSRVGYELLDRKRNIMLREMMSMMDEVAEVQDKIDKAYSEAYISMQNANFTIGQKEIFNIVSSIDCPNDITLRFKSIMGVEIPIVSLKEEIPSPKYGFVQTNTALDDAYIKFLNVKRLTASMAALENSVYRLAYAIKQSQKRANALKNIVIPQLEETISYISSYLEEKERESFTVLKVIKSRK